MFLVPAAATDVDQGEVVALVVARSKAVNADGAAKEIADRQCCVLIKIINNKMIKLYVRAGRSYQVSSNWQSAQL
jgi:hypothetical protein